MKFIENPETIEGYLAKVLKKWVVGIGPVYKMPCTGSGDASFDFGEAQKCLGRFHSHLAACIERVYVVCDTREEADSVFVQIIGDDGPTKLNSYNGPYTAYCCVFGPDGECVDANT